MDTVCSEMLLKNLWTQPIPRRMGRTTVVTQRCIRTLMASALLAPLVFASVKSTPAMAIAPGGDYIVILKDGVNLDRKVAKEAGLGNAVSDVYSSVVDGFVAELDNTDVARLRNDKDVLLVELDQILSINESSDVLGPDLSNLMSVPIADQYIVTLKNDVEPRAFAAVIGASATALTPEAPTSLWGLDRIDQRTLPLNNQFSRAFTGSGVTAYIIDTGVLSTHSEFGGRVSSGFSSVSDSNGTEDCNGHGTHVAGTVGGS